MRTEKTATDDSKRRGTAADHHLAAECKTLVITSAHATPDRAERLSEHIRRGGKDGRFDLLTVLDPVRLAVPGQLLDQVVADAKLAVELHKGEQIVVAPYGDPAPIVDALKRHPAFAKGGVEIRGFDLSRGLKRRARPEAASTIAVACMDFRQHDDRLADKFAEALETFDRPAVLAMAGGAKDLVSSTERGKLVIGALREYWRRRGFNQILLTCHTDCGAFGGDAAPIFLDGKGAPDARKQRRTLEERLRASAVEVRAALPEVHVMTGIVQLDPARGRIRQILRLRG